LNLASAPQYDPFANSLAGRRLGRYEVLARLASGGMAGVYVARAIGVAGFERLVAIKVLHPHLAHEQEFISMFLDEARLAARIRHPNVVPTTDISDTQDAGFYLVMDYIEGDHLGAILQAAYKSGARLPVPLTLRVVMDALGGLAAAHALTDESGRRINLVHRDISPHNIMVGTDGISRLTDFGVAKAEVRLSTTREGQFKGKLAYMSPEHASTGQTDQRSDLFSMGIILWECLTGRRLFRAENHAATLNLICLEPIPLPSSVEASLVPFDAILAKALDRDPDARFQTAEDFADAIEHVSHSQGGLSTARTVGKIVREYAAEKLEKDREVIQTSIAALSMQAGQPHVAPQRSEYAQPAPAAEVDDGEILESMDDLEEVAPQAATPVTAAPPSKAPWIAFGMATVAVVGAAIAYFVLGGDGAQVTSSSMADRAQPSAPAPTPPTAAPTPPTAIPVVPTAAPVAAPAPTASATAEPTPAVGVTTTTESDDDHSDSRRHRPRPQPSTAEVPAAPTPRSEPVQAAPTQSPRAPAPTREPPPRKPAAPAADDLFLNPYRH